MLDEYFIEPILRNGWFNPINTIVYALILVVAVFYVYKFLRRIGIEIDEHFFDSLIPFIFWASTTRVLHDAAFKGELVGFVGNIYSLPIFVTPGSYFITFFLTIIVLFISLKLKEIKGIDFRRLMFFIGILLTLINFIFIPFKTLIPFTHFILPVFILWTFIFLLLKELAKNTEIYKLEEFLSNRNILIILSHLLDATSTWTAIAFFGYVEQHVLPRSLIYFFGPATMFILKLIVVIPALYFVDKYSKDYEFKNLLKFVILVLGLAPGIRDTIRLLALV